MKTTIFCSIVCLLLWRLSFHCYATGKEFDVFLVPAGVFIWFALMAYPKDVSTRVMCGVMVAYFIVANMIYTIATKSFSLFLLGITLIVVIVASSMFRDGRDDRKRGNGGYRGRGGRGHDWKPPPPLPPFQPQGAPTGA